MNTENFTKVMFPGAKLGRGGKEANGLSLDAVPQNCEVIDHFHDNHYAENDLREHYLVKVDGVLIHLRICSAGEWTEYPAFAVILRTGDEAVDGYHSYKKCFAS